MNEKGVESIISEMTLDEKIAQLGSVWIYELLEDGKLSVEKMERLIGNGIGQITRIGGASGLPPEKSARLANEIQRFLKEKTRLRIPAIVHEECLNGYMAKGATIFPQMIGMASSWDPDLMKTIASVIREQMRSVGAHQGLAPLLDVARDPRWGRVEETFGEDPYLISTMATHYIQGLQGEDLKEGVMATAKHFVAYGISEGGMNCAPAHVAPRGLREIFLLPFEIAVKEAKVHSLMNAYNEIDGIPCGASKELLTDILRGEWGFDGVVVSDYSAIDMLVDYHRVASDKKEAAKLALEAGIDVELPSKDCYDIPLKKALKEGLISEDLINESLRRILRVKFRLGLFEDPYVNVDDISRVFDIPKQRELALEAARESIVLLKNEDDVLPLKKDMRSIAVIGPNASNGRNLLGDYSYPAHMEGRRIRTAVKDISSVSTVSVLEGIKRKVSEHTVVRYARGCDVLDDSKEGFEKAVRIARESDVAILVVGDRSGLTLPCTTGEGRDRADLALPGVQEELIRAVYETGTPVVVVLINGRPLSIEWIAEHVPAILECWLPGEEGGDAVADVLFGDHNPGGKLPMSFPRTVGQIPVYYSHKPSGGRSHWHGDYVSTSAKPLFPFGYGMSYTRFEYTNLRITPDKMDVDGKVKISVEVKNIGDRRGDEIVQLYINDEMANVTRPVKELKGFKRITLSPGEKKTIVFTLSADQLAFYDRDMKLVVEPGTFKVMVGSSSEDIRLEGRFEISGDVRELDGKREYFSDVEVK